MTVKVMTMILKVMTHAVINIMKVLMISIVKNGNGIILSKSFMCTHFENYNSLLDSIDFGLIL